MFFFFVNYNLYIFIVEFMVRSYFNFLDAIILYVRKQRSLGVLWLNQMSYSVRAGTREWQAWWQHFEKNLFPGCFPTQELFALSSLDMVNSWHLNHLRSLSPTFLSLDCFPAFVDVWFLIFCSLRFLNRICRCLRWVIESCYF